MSTHSVDESTHCPFNFIVESTKFVESTKSLIESANFAKQAACLVSLRSPVRIPTLVQVLTKLVVQPTKFVESTTLVAESPEFVYVSTGFTEPSGSRSLT